MEKGDRNSSNRSRFAYGLLGIVLAILLWEIASARVGVSLILPGPAEVAASFFSLAKTAGFWVAVGGTFRRVLVSFFISLVLGSVTGILAGLYPSVQHFTAPFLTIIRATPVMALILIIMFWFPAGHVPVFSAILMAYPVVHTGLYQGTIATDRTLLEMARVFRVQRKTVFFRLRLPAIRGDMASAAKNSLGLCWKVVVAGEVLSQPSFALGSGMQSSRLSLDTPGVFAWAIASIMLCGLSEFLLGLVARHLQAGGSSDE
ncbi:MAG: ABC transporter permease subunit [Spirochaetaceae bacterium]|nr:ABC transporter permease subunit [Spirochaetaceae bacterium]